MNVNLPILMLLAGPLTTLWATPFENLDFDSANTANLVSGGIGGGYYNPPYQNVGSGTPSDLIPGWTVLFGTSPYPEPYWLNLNSIGGAQVSIYDRNNYLGNPSVRLPVQGTFSFALWPGSGIPPLSLVQTGDVPSGTEMINFTSFGAGVQLFVNGSLIPLTYTYGQQTFNANTRLASVEGDISAFAGQTVELKFTSLPLAGTGADLNGLDSIYFSPVPEPGILALSGLGLVCFGIYRWSKERQA
jgi:hypothetical protein